MTQISLGISAVSTLHICSQFFRFCYIYFYCLACFLRTLANLRAIFCLFLKQFLFHLSIVWVLGFWFFTIFDSYIYSIIFRADRRARSSLRSVPSTTVSGTHSGSKYTRTVHEQWYGCEADGTTPAPSAKSEKRALRSELLLPYKQ